MVRFNASLNLRLTLFVAVFTSTAAVAQQVTLEATLDQLVEGGEIIAAQAVVGRGGRILVDHAVGVTVPGGNQKVDADTMFCIGSCSKPFASLAAKKAAQTRKPSDAEPNAEGTGKSGQTPAAPENKSAEERQAPTDSVSKSQKKTEENSKANPEGAVVSQTAAPESPKAGDHQEK